MVWSAANSVDVKYTHAMYCYYYYVYYRTFSGTQF